jgi:hypothetical protein
MNEEQKKVLQYAYLDLAGFVEWYENGCDPMTVPEIYEAVTQTLEDMENAFGEELKEMMENDDER